MKPSWKSELIESFFAIFRIRQTRGSQEYHVHNEVGLNGDLKNDKSESIARMMSLFLGLTLLLRLVTDVLSDPYLKELVIVNAETAARWSEALNVLSVVRKVSAQWV